MTGTGQMNRPAAPGILITDAGLRFGGRQVFQNLNVQVGAAAWTAILGPSGIGKSSLLRLVAGLPAERAALEGSVSASDNAPLSGRIAYMAQRDLLLPWASILDNVLIGKRLRRERIEQADRDRALELLDAVGLSDRATERPEALSGGMRQRAALARTLMEDRPIVVMDEPFSALDALTRFQLQETAYRLLRDRTVLLVTHDPMEALRLSGTILILHGAPPSIRTVSDLPPVTDPRDPADPDMAARIAALLAELAANSRPEQRTA